jgi:Na+-translocating ferredoxin:NAD+ oxidoreductase RnfD subunit
MNAPGRIELSSPAQSAETPAREAEKRRSGGLVRFAIAITILNLLGHFWLGFEPSWATPLVALAASYGTELVCEWASARAGGRVPRFLGSPRKTIMFFLSAHITGLAVSMLLYAAEQLWAVAFAAALAIGSKYLVRATLPGGQTRHVYNPSNLGIAVTLLLFPTVGIAPPYQFGENLFGALDWLLPLLIVTTGTLINRKFTQRLPLIGAWLAGFAAQALIRALLNGTPLAAGLAPMTGFAFILFTFYMVTDPATTPDDKSAQRLFGASVAFAYAVLMELHLVFGLFFALAAVSTLRGLALVLRNRLPSPLARIPLPQTMRANAG